MLLAWILAFHIAVLGYWLGTELVINSTYRYVCYHDNMPFEERSRLMDHVMHADQHVRYALVLQATLGTMLAARFGFFPGGEKLLTAAMFVGIGWLGFVEVVHRLRKSSSGAMLARIDRAWRYFVMLLLLLIALSLVGADWPVPGWLRLKLALFAGVIACGVGIRIALISHFRVWATMQASGVNQERNAVIKRTYWRATSVLILLWVFIAAIVFLSVMKPV